MNRSALSSLLFALCLLFAGCSTTPRPADERYPWHGPLTDPSGSVVQAPTYDEVP